MCLRLFLLISLIGVLFSSAHDPEPDATIEVPAHVVALINTFNDKGGLGSQASTRVDADLSRACVAAMKTSAPKIRWRAPQVVWVERPDPGKPLPGMLLQLKTHKAFKAHPIDLAVEQLLEGRDDAEEAAARFESAFDHADVIERRVLFFHDADIHLGLALAARYRNGFTVVMAGSWD